MTFDRQAVDAAPIAEFKKNGNRLLSLANWLLWTPAHDGDGWRGYIDGLRAISVLSVVFYHSGLITVSGGFIGVDVFLVISGFLISRVIYDDIASHGKFRIVSFYERRARRILPVFSVVTAAAVIAGYFLLLPDEFAALGRSAIYACGFAGNIFFYLTSGYFGPQAITQPLLHYWSLGVEEQFYIVFPLVVLAILKIAPRLLGAAILSIGVASFAVAEFYVRTDPSAAFYLAPQRAWELLAGSMLALPGFPYLKQQFLREIVAAIGLALILVAAFTYSLATPFPGLTAVAPVAGAACILWACEGSRTLVGALLSIRPLRHIGLWSYSIYMIHWPIIVFAHVIWPHGATELGSAFVAVSIAFGGLSYFLLETPFRKPRQILSRLGLFEASFASLLVLAGSGLIIVSMQGFPQRLPQPVRQILAYKRYGICNGGWSTTGGDGLVESMFCRLSRQDTCFLAPSQELQPDCLAAGRPSALLWGDSGAAHYYAALKDRFPDIVILQANMAACAPIVGIRPDVPQCNGFNDMALHWALVNKPDTIILSAVWPTDAVSLSKLDDTVKALRSADLPVIIVGKTSTYLDSVPNILARRLLGGNHDSRAEDEELGAPFWGDYYMKGRYSGLDGVRYISFQDTFCKGRECPLVTESGVPMWWDNYHFTREGADLVLKQMFPGGLLKGMTPVAAGTADK
jgi:peptidoglycan/LPS O-acetylase OafA/YrhL